MSDPTKHQIKRQQIIDMLAACPFYKKSDKAPDTYTSTHIEDASRVTIQVTRNKIRIWKINFEVKPAPLIAMIDLDKFAKYVYNVVGVKYDGG
jgi:hypothetical protein